MTDYCDFIRDFPARCGEVLDLCYGQAKAANREVTLLIMTAAAAFVPFERLRSGPEHHPSRDRQRFPKEAQRLDDALGRPFLNSLFHDDGSASWSMGTMPYPKLPIEFKSITGQTPANQVFAIVRNSLAHGNLWTISDTGSQIEAIIFWAKDQNRERRLIGYKYVRTSPKDFHKFLVKWFAFLKREQIPRGVVADTLAQAA
ncbi:MAG: hypothetical protein JO007_11155 [Alphaproteobacteria bacterium]|nr:hypothetical protein [Alphaproteobacteria bacterium]